MSQRDLTPARAVIDRSSLTEHVEKILYGEIVSGQLRRGARINEAELARSLGTSRNPVREAIRKLEERGLVVSIPHRGSFVRDFDEEEIRDLYAFRICIESAAIRAALPRMTDADLAGLGGILERMARAAQAGDAAAVVEADLELHHGVCELSGSRRLVRAFRDIHAEVRMLTALLGHRYASLDEAVLDHRGWLAILGRRDVDAAVAATVAHIEDAAKRVAELWGR